jgi:hypothetical protein
LNIFLVPIIFLANFDTKMTEKQDRVDGVFLSLASSLSGGVPEIFDCLFSFLSRKTDFYTGADVETARKIVQNAFDKYAATAKEVKNK